jgi:hypothetical protein
MIIDVTELLPYQQAGSMADAAAPVSLRLLPWFKVRSTLTPVSIILAHFTSDDSLLISLVPSISASSLGAIDTGS